MYLLDTNVISELRKVGDDKADTHVTAWLARTDAARFYLSAVTILELELGVLLRLRRDAVQGGMLREWLDTRVLPEFADRTLAIDTAVAVRCAALHIPDPLPVHDALIAATALIHQMTVVTRNVGDFARTGVQVVNPWDPKS